MNNLKQVKHFKRSSLQLIIAGLFVSSIPVHAYQNKSQRTDTNSTNDATETMVVTANRTLQDKFEVLAAVEVFERVDIERIQPLSVGELLNRVAGISITNQGTQAHQTAVQVRGSNSNQVLVLVNGVRVGSATLGVKNVATIPVQLIERVEIVRGPRASLWGSDAIGGVIQIFTRDYDAGEGQIGAKLGNDNYWQTYAALGFGSEQHKYTLSASAEASDGFDIIVPASDNPYGINQPDDDGYHQESIALNGLSQFTDTFSVELNGQYDQGKTEIDASFGGDENEFENHHFMMRNHWQLSHVYLQLSLANSKDSNHDNQDKLVSGLGNNHFETKRNQASFLAQYPISDSTELLAGAEWYDEEIDSNNAYSTDDRDANAFSLAARHQVNALSFEASVRRDEVGDIDAETTYQGAVGYQINSNLLISLNHGTGFKAPTFNDLYYPWGGNPNLEAETAENTEIITKYRDDIWSVEVSLYHTNYDNLIEWAPIDPSDPFSLWQPENIAEARIKGAEVTADLYLGDFSHQITMSHIDAENEKTKNQLYRRPYFSSNYNVNYQLEDWDLSADIVYKGHRTDTNNRRLSSYTLLNIAASYTLTSQVTLLAKINNLTDKDYEQVSEYPGAERGFNVGIDYKF